MAPVYFGKETIDNAAAQLDKDIQSMIVEGKEIAGVK